MHSLKKSVKPEIVNRYDLWVLRHKIGGAKLFVNNVVTESHHIVLIKFSLLNRTTLIFVLKLSPLQVAKFDVCTQYK
jgi:hypothetical protein